MGCEKENQWRQEEIQSFLGEKEKIDGKKTGFGGLWKYTIMVETHDWILSKPVECRSPRVKPNVNDSLCVREIWLRKVSNSDKCVNLVDDDGNGFFYVLSKNFMIHLYFSLNVLTERMSKI